MGKKKIFLNLRLRKTGKSFAGNLLTFTSYKKVPIQNAIAVHMVANDHEAVNYLFKNVTTFPYLISTEINTDYFPSIAAVGLLGAWIQRDSGNNLEKDLVRFVKFNKQ